MTGNEPSEDPSEAPTGMYDHGSQEAGDVPPDQPWYRRPIVSLTAALLAAILLGLVIYLLADRMHGSGTSKQTPTSPTTSTVVSTPATAAPTTTEPAAPPTTTTMTFPPATTAPAAPTTTAPTGTSIQGHHHHHHHDGGTP